MIAFALVALFFLGAFVSIGMIGAAISAALPKIRELRAELAEASAGSAITYEVREVVVMPTAKVIALPVRERAMPAEQPLRAAA